MGIATLPQIQGYKVQEEIESGGFGVVYRATQPLLGRDVAIKFILPHYANEPEFVRNFEAEAQRVARLEHPHIVPVYDYWRDPHGAYLVMRWLPRTLKGRLQEGALTLTETLHLLDQIADALAATHRQGVIHRDIKPGNILVDDQNNYYLTDFGIAKDLLSRAMTGSHIMKGTVAYIAPEQARGEVVSPQTDIYSLGVMLYEVLTGQHPLEGLSSAEMIVKHLNEPLPDLPAILQLPMELNAVLQKATAKQPIERYHDTLQFAQAFRVALPASTIVQSSATSPRPLADDQPTTMGQQVLRNPYKGLHAFELMDAGDFYGREALVQQLLTRLQEDHPFQHFLAVVGASGSGKSSVVKAGLLPALRAGYLPGSRDWFTVEMSPSEHPLQELTNALNRVATKTISHISEQLRADRRGLIWAVASLLSDDARLVLVVDQFEELFTTSVDEDEVAQFLEVLRVAASDVTSGVRIIITLRADFMDRPLHYLDFADLLKQRIEYVLPLSPSELAEAITRPAEQVGLQVEAGLVTAIVADVQDEPGALPLLQYTLTELFDRHVNHTLTLAAYQHLGGLSGALLQRADQTFEQFSPTQQALICQMFMRLVTLGEGVEDTRRRVRQSELLALVDNPDTLLDVLGRFGQARLLTFDRDPITREPTVEVAHEALIREWRRLRTWLDDSRYDIRQQRLLAAAAHEWENAKRDKSYLLTGSRLAQFEGWVGQTPVALTPDERALVDASITENLRQQTVRRRVRNAALVTISAVALILAVLALFAFDRAAKAQQQADINHSLVLANSAETVLEDGYDTLAIRLALEAVDMENPPSEAISALSNIAFGIGTRALLREQGNLIKTVAFSPDATVAISGGCTTLVENTCSAGELVLWDLEDRVERFHFVGHKDWVNSAMFSPDGLTILSASSDSTLILWDVRNGSIIRDFVGSGGSVNTVVFAPDGNTAFSGADDGIITQWDIGTGLIVRQFENQTGAITTLAVNSDGTILASGSEDTTIQLWNLATNQPTNQLNGHTASIVALAFVPSSNTILSIDKSLLLEWDIASGELQRRYDLSVASSGLSMFPNGRKALFSTGVSVSIFDLSRWQREDKIGELFSYVTALALSPDGRLALSGYEDGVLRLTNMPFYPEIRRFEADVPQMSLDVSPDGQYLLTGSYRGGTAILWDLKSGQEIRRIEGQADGIAIVKFSPDGNIAALGSADWWGSTDDKMLVLIDVKTGTILHRLEGHQFGPRSAAFSPDGKYLLTGSLQYTQEQIGKGDLILWDVKTGQLITRFDMTDSVTSIAFSPDGEIVYTGSSAGITHQVHVASWNRFTGEPIAFFDRSGFAIKLSPDGKNLLANWNLLDPITGNIIRHYVSLPDVAWGLDVSLDWHYAAAGWPWGEIGIVNLQTGSLVRQFSAYRSPVWNIMFSPDGKSIYSSAYDGPVIQWQVTDWPLDDLLEWVHENRYIRDFTCEERAQYRIEPLCEQ